MKETRSARSLADSPGRHLNSGNGAALVPIDISHSDYVGLVDPDAAFWSLIKRDNLADAFTGSEFVDRYLKKREAFLDEMQTLRFAKRPTAVYFNPTERCNLNCRYCYVPESMRRGGECMSADRTLEALGLLRDHFRKTLPPEMKAQIIFHGSEPMIARDAIFAGIKAYRDDFHFGVQTNGTLLDEDAIQFLVANNIGIGLSLDGPTPVIADRTRATWSGSSVYRNVIGVLERLRGYPNYNVICTVTQENVSALPEMVDFLHSMDVPVCMLNPVRCTQHGAREIKPDDAAARKYYLKALDRTYELYQKTSRKLVVANFANILLSILAPTARRLMCDISPCGGGRCFFALAATGDLFPCSEFVGIPEFNGGNLFKGELETALDSPPFRSVTTRKVEDITPCAGCAVRHFCGAPCPAEAWQMHGSVSCPGGFCDLYEEQARYALRLIADQKQDAYLWDNWSSGTRSTLNLSVT